jgi:hypothetical protein
MRLMKSVAVLAVVCGVGYYGITKYFLPGDAYWVHGTWWYADSSGRIVTGKDKDGMVFGPDGSVDLVDGSRNRYLGCVYTDLVDREIRVKCEMKGKTRELIFLINDDNTQLANVDDPDSGFYVKE